ncbi:MAG: DUF2254 family protein [Gemmatimonadota bacterium]
MNPSRGSRGTERLADLRDNVRRAFREFLSIPTALIAFFLVLAVLTTILDRRILRALDPVGGFLRTYVFTDTQATGDLLATIAGSLVGITAFSFGLLVLAVQQTAASMTSHVVDQFLRRRMNQFYFGFFVGLALFALVILATVGESYNPIYGASLALILTGVALCMLLLLLYTTINQIRPMVVIEALHDLTLSARKAQMPLIERTRRGASFDAGPVEPIHSEQHGFVVDIDLDRLERALSKMGGCGLVLRVSIGDFVAFGDRLAEIRGQSLQDGDDLRRAVQRAIKLERQRDLRRDPAFGIEQLTTIAWTSVSTSKSNPAPGLATIRALRDILARWACDGRDTEDGSGPDEVHDAVLPVVYVDDVVDELMDALETLAVVSTESMQHQSYAEVVRALTALFDRLPAWLQDRTEDIIRRILSGLGDHVLTADLDAALTDLVRTLRSAGRWEATASVREAQEDLRTSIGKLNSRSTRVP